MTREKARRLGVIVTACGVLVGGLSMPAPGAAQSATSSSIYGTIADSTGGTLPGVTVTLTSPALQVPQVVAVSGADGNYRLVDLPAGTYQIVYELTGFTRIVRSEVRLTTGFQAKIDVAMALGGLEETITVSGESPIVDVSSTSTGATLTQDVFDAIPRAKEFSALLTMTPGVIASGAPDVGGSSLASRYQVDAFGVAAQPKLSVEGINTTTGSGNNSAVVFSSYNFDEVKVSTSGADAETSTPGISIVAVLKSGSNTFRGTIDASLQRPELQASNIDDALRAQGITIGDQLKNFYGISGDLGGRIVRDKLWFYGGVNRQRRTEESLGFVENAGPDGVFLTGDEPAAVVPTTLDGHTAKLSYQMSKSTKLVGVYQRGTKLEPRRSGGRFRPLEAVDNYYDPTWVWKGEMQSAVSDRLLINVNSGWGGYFADHSCPRAAEIYYGDRRDIVSRRYNETGLQTGPCSGNDKRPRSRYQLDSSVSYFPARSVLGRHELKAGESIYWENTYTYIPSLYWGNYELEYDIVDGVSNAPFLVRVFNYPTDPRNRLDTYAGYVKDTWRITNDLTANIGVRYEFQHAYLPAQAFPGSPEWPSVFPARSFEPLDVLRWHKVMPRVGVAYQVATGSVVKASWGVYANTAGDDFAERYNGNADASATFRWRDVDGNDTYTPGEVNLDLNGADFISITSANNNILNRDLEQPTTKELTTTWEQEVTKSMGVRAQYVYKRMANDYASVNVLRPYGAYSNQIVRVDPGADGIEGSADDGGPITLYDYANAYRGAAFVGNKLINTDAARWYHSFEVGATKRLSSRWSAMASYFATKSHAPINTVVADPNQEAFNLDETWQWGSTVSGTYRMPGDFQLSGFLQAKSGAKGERSYVFRNIPNARTLTRRLGPRGSVNNPSFTTMNFRVARDIRIGFGRIETAFDVFNLFNANTATNITKASGPTYGYVTGVLQPRVAQIGVRYSF